MLIHHVLRFSLFCFCCCFSAKLSSVLTAVSIPVCSRYEELRYWYDCLFYEEELRQYHDYMAAIEEIESRQYHEVCFSTFYPLCIFL